MKKFLSIFIALLLLMITGCSDEQSADSEKTAPPEATATFTPMTSGLSVEQRLEYEGYYETLRQLHADMDAVWGSLSGGEDVQCGQTYETVSPGLFSDDTDELARALKSAAIELQSAVDLWQAECQNSRPNVPAATIDEGLLMVKSAGDSLSEAEGLLAENQN